MSRALAADLAEGARLHDAGQWWDAHEAWESTWRAEKGETRRRFVQALIQITAAFHKLLVMKSADGAVSLLTRGIAKLEGIADDYEGVDVARLREEARGCLAVIARIEARGEAAESFDRSLIPRLIGSSTPKG